MKSDVAKKFWYVAGASNLQCSIVEQFIEESGT